jgi:hypothetical protein
MMLTVRRTNQHQSSIRGPKNILVWGPGSSIHADLVADINPNSQVTQVESDPQLVFTNSAVNRETILWQPEHLSTVGNGPYDFVKLEDTETWMHHPRECIQWVWQNLEPGSWCEVSTFRWMDMVCVDSPPVDHWSNMCRQGAQLRGICLLESHHLHTQGFNLITSKETVIHFEPCDQLPEKLRQNQLDLISDIIRAQSANFIAASCAENVKVWSNGPTGHGLTPRDMLEWIVSSEMRMKGFDVRFTVIYGMK